MTLRRSTVHKQHGYTQNITEEVSSFSKIDFNMGNPVVPWARLWFCTSCHTLLIYNKKERKTAKHRSHTYAMPVNRDRVLLKFSGCLTYYDNIYDLVPTCRGGKKIIIVCKRLIYIQHFYARVFFLRQLLCWHKFYSNRWTSDPWVWVQFPFLIMFRLLVPINAFTVNCRKLVVNWIVNTAWWDETRIVQFQYQGLPYFISKVPNCTVNALLSNISQVQWLCVTLKQCQFSKSTQHLHNFLLILLGYKNFVLK